MWYNGFMNKNSINEKLKIENKKSAFTFAELMISLLVISILSAILYPTIAHFTPNSNKPLFKSAYKILNTIVGQIVSESPNGTISDEVGMANNNQKNIRVQEFCRKFCERANVVFSDANPNNPKTCTNECTLDAWNDNKLVLTTTNGMRWRFRSDVTEANGLILNRTNPYQKDGSCNRSNSPLPVDFITYGILVDVNASNNGLTQQFNNRNLAGRNSISTIDNAFNSCWTAQGNPAWTDRKGHCGVFYFAATTNAESGIYTTCPNYINVPITKEEFNVEHLRMQDTFEIIIDNQGKIVYMAPGAWANLEDHTSAGN